MTRRLCSFAVLFGLAAGLVATVAASAAAQGDPLLADVPDDAYYTVPVTELAGNGVFDGTLCDAGFCPGEPMDRATMAVWMVRVLDGQDPPAVSQTRFNDVDPASFHAPFIERMADLGVTGGCGDGTDYCPDRAVTRAQMAVFLTRAFDLAEGPDPGFGDVPSDAWYATAVAALAASGITGGCGDGTTFCPSQDTTRAQMATFLHRALTPPPTARFTAVDVGDRHACAIRVDKTIVCWGNNDQGQATAPDGQFTAVAVGYSHTCGVRTDNPIICWGDTVFSATRDTPDSQFSAIATNFRHTCGLRTDNTVVCWDVNDGSQSEAPDGQFSAVTAGDSHFCGLRTNNTIDCWGDNEYGQTDAPNGRFSTVDASGRHTCALRTDNTITCWGGDIIGQSEAPDGQLSAITTSGRHTCALRTDNTIDCWGDGSDPPSGRFSAVSAGGRDASCGLRLDGTIACWGIGYMFRFRDVVLEQPAGRFKAITAGEGRYCAVRTDGTIDCWGSNSWGQSDPPDGRFSQVAVAIDHSCGLRTDGTAACWGNNYGGKSDPPDGQFSTIVTGWEHSCGLRTNNTITCWGNKHDGKSDPPDGQFSTIVAGREHSCGLRTNNTITCWGNNDHGQNDAPSGQFSTITLGAYHSCGLRTDNTVACWGNNYQGRSDPPDGQFSKIAATCGLRTDNTIACWGPNPDGQSDPPDGQFSAVTAVGSHTCALRIDGTIACWDLNHYGHSDAADGQFSAVTAGSSHACGLRTDNTVTCWGNTAVAPPAGVAFIPPHDWPDPDSCRPYGAFPRDGSTPTIGKVRVAVLFVDFPDAPADYSTQDETGSNLDFAEEYLEASSYGKLDLEFVPLHRWLRAEQSFRHYEGPTAGGSQVQAEDEAVRLADPYFDFSGIHIVLVVHPSAYGRFGWAGDLRNSTDEGRIGPVSAVNAVLDTQRSSGAPRPWGGLATHELAHNLGGLPDLYPYVGYQEQELSGLRARLFSDQLGRWSSSYAGPMGFYFGLMGLAISIEEYEPNGAEAEMLAWNRFLLGWLDANQVRCVTESDASVSLDSISDLRDGMAMVVIPYTSSSVIVVESRRVIRADESAASTQQELTLEDGTIITSGDISSAARDEGVLIYSVNSSHGSGSLPIKGAGQTERDFVGESPFLTEGESITVRGYRITLVADDGVTHTVSITKMDPSIANVTTSLSSTAPTAVHGSFDVAITFSQPVSGLEPDDILVLTYDDWGVSTGGTVSSISGSGREYTATVVPENFGYNADLAVSVRPGAVRGSSGRPNTMPKPITRQFVPPEPVVTGGPTVTLSSSAPQYVQGSFDVTITFSAPVTGVEQRKVIVINGTASSVSGSGELYTVTVTPGSELPSVLVFIANGAAVDELGRPNSMSEMLCRDLTDEPRRSQCPRE